MIGAAKEEKLSGLGPWCADLALTDLELGENSRPGFERRNAALHLGQWVCNSTTALGIERGLFQNCFGSRIQTWNRYAYVNNNPMAFVDPLGLESNECDIGEWCWGPGGGGSGYYSDPTGVCPPSRESCGDDTDGGGIGIAIGFPVGGGIGGDGPRPRPPAGNSSSGLPPGETLGLPGGLNPQPFGGLNNFFGLLPNINCGDFVSCGSLGPGGLGFADADVLEMGLPFCAVQPEVCVVGLGLVTAGVVGYEGYQLYRHFSSNIAQNRQFDEAVRQIESKCGRKLDKGDRRRLHDEITGQGFSIPDIVEIGVGMFCPGS